MVLPVVSVLVGLVVLVWSADRFVDGAAGVARHLGLPPLLIGMVIIGFGTSAPEIVVSAFSAAGGNVGLALGNAYGSNISNIALILGVAALIRPITVDSGILRRELPVLAGVTLLATYQLLDRSLSRGDAWFLLAVFGLLMGWTLFTGFRVKRDPLVGEMKREMAEHPVSLRKASFMLAYGMIFLVGSSRLLVDGAVAVASGFGVSDLLIGLTVVAFGTSVPELASAIAASRKGEDDLALGNVLGSNLFNTLAVVGLAGAIRPSGVSPEVIYRDMPVMIVLTVSLFLFGYGFRGEGKINRVEAACLVAAYLAYTAYLVFTAVSNGS